MKTKKRTIQIFYVDEFGEAGSIIQVMSKLALGTWLWYFLDNGCSITNVIEI